MVYFLVQGKEGRNVRIGIDATVQITQGHLVYNPPNRDTRKVSCECVCAILCVLVCSYICHGPHPPPPPRRGL